MRKWQTIAVTALSTLTLSTAGFVTYNAMQPTHYEGATFTNEKQEQSTSHSSSATSTSSSSDNQSSPSSTDTASTNPTYSEPASVAPQEPSTKTYYEGLTFRTGSIDMMTAEDGTKKEMTYIYCNQTGDMTKNIPYEDAQPFMAWLYAITEGKHYMNNTMDSNYHYWLENVKGQQ